MEWLESLMNLPEGATQLTMAMLVIRRLVATLGILVILYGACQAFFYFIGNCFSDKNFNTMDKIRLKFGSTIILGLEFIVASDLIETTVAPDFYSVGILASLVAIRTLLTYFMNRELMSLKMKKPLKS